MKRIIPNFITLLNLAAGALAIIAVLKGAYPLVAGLLAVCFLTDYLDGFLARLLRVQSPLGTQLDSLADMVSFGLLPGLIAYQLIGELPGFGSEGVLNVYGLPALLIPVTSAVRLGRFNLDDRQLDAFIGLPTPASALFFMGLMLIHEYADGALALFTENIFFLYGGIILFSYLLNAPIVMFNLKLKNLTWKDNSLRYLFLTAALLLLVVLKELAFSPIILVYILFSIIMALKAKVKEG